MQKKLLVTLLFLLGICSNCYSAETTYYVDVDVVGGDADGSSLANAYSSLQTAETARQADITAGNAVRFLCHNTSGGTDVAAAISFWTTDADSYISVEAASAYRHAGIWDASKYHMAATDTGTFTITENYVRVDGIQLSVTITADNDNRTMYIASQEAADNDVRLSNLIMKGDGTGEGGMYGILTNDADAVVTVWNCVIYDFISDSHPADAGFGGSVCFNGVVNHYNCTVFGSYYGIRRTAGTVTADNCVVFNNTNDWDGTIVADYCASDDADATTYTNGQDFTAEATDWNKVFTEYDAANPDVSLKNYTTPPCCVGTGTDDPGDPIQEHTDIAENARSSTWDIGAFELVAAAAAGQVIIISM